MGVPQGKARLRTARATSGQPGLAKILYRAAFLVVLGCMTSPVVAAAQEELPQIDPGARRAPRKKDAEPRAVAVMQLAANGKASLVPIAILIDGKFWDASAYKASPVPMALEPGTVYEAERTGNSQGLFTVSSALRSNAVNAINPWIGTGSWVPAGLDTAKKALQAEPMPVGIDTSDAPPRLTKNPQKAAPPASTAPAAPPSSTTSKPSSGDAPPRLSKPAAPPSNMPSPTATPQGDSKGTAGSNPPNSGQIPGSPAPQSGTKPAETKAARPQEPASDSGTDASSRPRLRRGKPAESFADEEIPGYSQPGRAPSASAAKASTPATTGPVQLIPAISDSDGPEPHSYRFEWLQGEEEQRRQQMITMAKEQIRAYVEARAKAAIEPAMSASPASRHVPLKKLPEPVLSNVLMTAYDLWSTNQPVVILSAQAQMPPPSVSQAGSPVPSDDLQYSVLLVAHPDIYNNMHKLYAGVTDKYHLDLTPRLELIDAVDADGDGRGELLFRKTSDAGTGWAIYRVTADKLWKMFDSLNRE
jgi:hypothetical protein